MDSDARYRKITRVGPYAILSAGVCVMWFTCAFGASRILLGAGASGGLDRGGPLCCDAAGRRRRSAGPCAAVHLAIAARARRLARDSVAAVWTAQACDSPP